MAAGADILRLVRKGIDVGSLQAHTRKPFRFYLCGDPALVSEFRSLLLSGHDETVPLDAAACLETIVSDRIEPALPNEGRAIFFLGLPGDLAGANIDVLRTMRLPIFAITVDPQAPPSGP